MLDVHHDYLAVRFAADVDTRRRARVAERCHLLPYVHRERLSGERFSVHRVAPGEATRVERHGRALTALRDHEHVERVARVMRLGRQRVLATDRLWVRVAGGDRRGLRALERRGARILRSVEADHLVRLPPDLDPVREARRLADLVSVEHAEPDYVVLGRHIPSALGRDDRLAMGQFAIRVTGTREAWRHHGGIPDVVIAVIDDGVMAGHEDLEAAMAPGHDATGHRGGDPPPPWDGHGTGCAGLIAGRHHPRGGVRGVACGCRIMSVRVGRTPSRMEDYVTKVSWVAKGIDWAWKNGASVLNMSFGGGPPSRIIEAALERARARGRDGRGCVLVAAVGNAGEAAVEFPASLDAVIAVAATDEHDEPADFSNHGPEVDVAAPGVNCFTATIPDPEEDEADLYTTFFTGTSAAAPIVSGIAGLILSANPELTGARVRAIIRDTADPVGKRHPYREGRNDYMGRGRVDAVAALRAVKADAVLAG